MEMRYYQVYAVSAITPKMLRAFSLSYWRVASKAGH